VRLFDRHSIVRDRLNNARLYAVISRLIATPVIMFVSVLYVIGALFRPAADVYPVGFTILGTTAALSAICLTAPESVEGFVNVRWAGEKLLHATLLVIQTVMLLFIKSAMKSSPWLTAHPSVVSVGSWVIGVLFVLIAWVATITWFEAFRGLNSQLWHNMQCRLQGRVEHRPSPLRWK
jgi:hypothetical protein